MAGTAYFACITVSGGLVLGIAMALVRHATFSGRSVLRSVMLIPWGMAPVAVGILWSWMFDGSYGTLTEIGYALQAGIPVIGLNTWALSIGGRADDNIIIAENAEDAVEKALALAIK